MKKELDYLKTVKRKEIRERLERAIAFGDLTENAAYHEAKEAQGFLEGRILDLGEEIRNSVIISDEKKKDLVSIGSTVTLEKNGEKLKFKIVGVQETDPTGGKISNESPLGRAILDRKKGEIVEVETPSGRTKYKILKIE